MISLASIDYFSVQGIPFIFLAFFTIIIFQPFVTILHELGHAIFAIFLTNGKVVIRVGEEGPSFKFRNFFAGSRLSIEVSFKNTRVGYTQFDKQKKWSQLLILLGGPVFTFCLTLQAGELLFLQILPSWQELPLVSWFCGNFLALLRSVVPISLKPTNSFPQGPPSDGLQILRLLLFSSDQKKL